VTSLVEGILDAVAGLPRPLLFLSAGLLAMLECTLGVGLIVPGESGVLVAATAARTVPQMAALAAIVALGAAIGDSVGFWLGRRYGERLLTGRLGRRVPRAHWERSVDLLQRRGRWAVFGGRFVAVVRTVIPAAAGAAQVPYRVFLPASLLGASAWAILHTVIGAALGASARQLTEWVGRSSWILLGIVLLAAVAVLLRRRSGRATRAAAAASTPARAPRSAAPVPTAPVPAGPVPAAPGRRGGAGT
jgi:membrane protein DedA with SNARE-associated domain